MLLETWYHLFKRSKQPRGEFFLESVIVIRACSKFRMRPAAESVVAHEGEGLDDVPADIVARGISQRRCGKHEKRELGQRRARRRQHGSIDSIKISAPVAPVVAGIQAHGPQVQINDQGKTEPGRGITGAYELAPEFQAQELDADKTAERHRRVGVAQNIARTDLGAVLKPYADGAIFINQNPFNFSMHFDLTAGPPQR